MRRLSLGELLPRDADVLQGPFDVLGCLAAGGDIRGDSSRDGCEAASALLTRRGEADGPRVLQSGLAGGVHDLCGGGRADRVM